MKSKSLIVDNLEERLQLYLKLTYELYSIRKKNKFKRSKDEDAQIDIMADLWYTFSGDDELTKFEEFMYKVPIQWDFRNLSGNLIEKSPIEYFYEQNPVIFTPYLMEKYKNVETHFGSKIRINRPRLYFIIANHEEGKPKLVIALDTDLKHMKKYKFISYYKDIPVFEKEIKCLVMLE